MTVQNFNCLYNRRVVRVVIRWFFNPFLAEILKFNILEKSLDCSSRNLETSSILAYLTLYLYILLHF